MKQFYVWKNVKIFCDLPCAAETVEKLAKIWLTYKAIVVLPNSFNSLLIEDGLRQEFAYEDVDFLLAYDFL